MSSCGTDPQIKVVTRTETVEVPVEVYKPLPDTLTRAVPYPPGLPEDFTVGDLFNLTFDLYDALDTANADKAKAGQLTKQPPSSEPVPQ